MAELNSDESDIEKRIIEDALHRILGVSIAELSQDLAARLKDPLFRIEINFDMKFKEAKKKFKGDYLKKILTHNFGNVSEVARVTGINRRTIHRICSEKSIINVRNDIMGRNYRRKTEMESIIAEVARSYRDVLHPSKIQDLHHYAPALSAQLANVLPDNPLPMKHAVQIFEKRYIEVLVPKYHTLKEAARAAGVQYETLLRKMKRLGIRK